MDIINPCKLMHRKRLRSVNLETRVRQFRSCKILITVFFSIKEFFNLNYLYRTYDAPVLALHVNRDFLHYFTKAVQFSVI